LVIVYTGTKTWNEKIVCVTTTNISTRRSSGTVIPQNCCHPLAPSMRDAS
jgi:hypothetical protein